MRAGQGPSNAYNISKAGETNPVMRSYTSRTEAQHPNHPIQFPSVNQTSAHPVFNKPQFDPSASLPDPGAYVDAPAKRVSTVEPSFSSKKIPKDVGSGSQRNMAPVTSIQTPSVATGPNAPPLLQISQPDTSKPVEKNQPGVRHSLMPPESHPNIHVPQRFMDSGPAPSAIADVTAPSAHVPTKEPPSLLKNRDGGTTSLTAIPASNIQASATIGQKNLPTAQPQSDYTQTQACLEPGNRFHCPLKCLI
jgi:hypothetical protein